MRNRLTDRLLRTSLAFALSALPSVAFAAHNHPKPAPLPPVTIRVFGPMPNQQLIGSHITVMLNRGKTPINGAKVTVDLSMPGMSMPKTIVICSNSGPGVYDSSCTFTMSGTWLLKTVAQLPGGKTATLTTHASIR